MTIDAAERADEWVAAPTVAQTIHSKIIERDGHLPDLKVLAGWRYRLLARPLIRAADLILGSSSPTFGRIIETGAMVIKKGPEPTFARDDVVSEQRRRITVINRRNSELDREARRYAARASTAEGAIQTLSRIAQRIEETP